MPDFQQRNPEDVKNMFSEVSQNYDKINRAMCFGLDILWRKKLVKLALAKKSKAPKKIIDLACGSGDVCLELAKADKNANIVASDFCPEMLAIAKQKAVFAKLENRITFQQADCQKMPFENEDFDVATISFGFRNFQNRQECLTEIARILKNNGQLAILEVSRANAFMEWAQKIFMCTIVPIIATIFGGDKKSYQYLANTTMAYPYPKEVEKMFADAGFDNVKTHKLAFGLVAITTGVKK